MEDMCYERLRAEACKHSIGCVFNTAVPITKRSRGGGGGDNGGHVLECVFITAVPITKLSAV
jgi:hypothetical protein